MYLIALRIAASPPHATSRSKYCARNSAPSTSGSPPRQYTHENDCVTGWSGSTSAMVRRMAVPVKRSFDGSFSRCTPLESAPRAIVPAGDAGRVAGEHVHEAGRERADAAHAPVEVGDLLPAVEHVSPDFPVDLEPQRLGVEDVRHGLVGLGQDARTERAARDALLERVLQVLVLVELESLTHRDEEVDDLGEREVERGPGLVARPDQLVEVELGRREVLVLGVMLERRLVHAPADDVRHRHADRVEAHSMTPRT